MRKLRVLIGTIAISLCLIAPAALAANGIIRSLYPPGNGGGQHRAGQIEETDVGNIPLGRPYFIFQIPQDVDPDSPPVVEGARVTFDAVGQRALNVFVVCVGVGCPF